MDCPVCSSKSNLRYSISGNKIQTLIHRLLPDINPYTSLLPNYSLYKCSNCELEFSEPMNSGSNTFYDWVCKSAYYYPPNRWEWSFVSDFIDENGLNSILDVGCGSGEFLSKLTTLDCDSYGIDFNRDSINICKSKGLNVSAASVEDLMQTSGAVYEAITLFHVLEHVQNPLGLMLKLKTLLRRNGNIIVSVPSSPMSFEYDWFDPLNHPPHHLTRWNEKSMVILAKMLNLKIDIIYSNQLSSLKRYLNILFLKGSISPFSSTKLQFYKQIMKTFYCHPIFSIHAFFYLMKPFSRSGKGDTLVAIFHE